MHIHAIATQPPLNIKAALESTEMRAHAAKLRAASIEVMRPLTVHELDRKLADSPLSTADRIALKSAMSRVGLLV